MRNERTYGALVATILTLAGCAAEAPAALGTLEWDRVTLPSPVAEKIVRVDVREGQQVAAGAPLRADQLRSPPVVPTGGRTGAGDAAP